MKRTLLLLSIIGISMTAYSATQAVQGFCTVGGVKVMTSGLPSSTTVQASYPKCIVTVYDTGTINKSTIYSDAVGTPLANPFTANANASWLFYSTIGAGIDITLSGGTPNAFSTPYTLVDVIPAGGGGGGGSNLPGTQSYLAQYALPGVQSTLGPTGGVSVDTATLKNLTVPGAGLFSSLNFDQTASTNFSNSVPYNYNATYTTRLN